MSITRSRRLITMPMPRSAHEPICWSLITSDSVPPKELVWSHDWNSPSNALLINRACAQPERSGGGGTPYISRSSRCLLLRRMLMQVEIRSLSGLRRRVLIPFTHRRIPSGDSASCVVCHCTRTCERTRCWQDCEFERNPRSSLQEIWLQWRPPSGRHH